MSHNGGVSTINAYGLRESRCARKVGDGGERVVVCKLGQFTAYAEAQAW